MQRIGDVSGAVVREISEARRKRAEAAGLTVEEHDARLAEDLLASEAAERAWDRAKLEAMARARARVPGCDIAAATLDTEATRHARRWYTGPEAALVLCGGVGTGKSTAAALVAYEAELAALLGRAQHVTHLDREERGKRFAAFGPSVDVVAATMLGRRFDPWKQDADAGVVPLATGCALLVLDDLGTEAPGDRRFTDALFQIVDTRSERKTLITTNVARADIRPRYGDRIADRLNHIGRAVEIKGASMRRKGEL